MFHVEHCGCRPEDRNCANGNIEKAKMVLFLVFGEIKSHRNAITGWVLSEIAKVQDCEWAQLDPCILLQKRPRGPCLGTHRIDGELSLVRIPCVWIQFFESILFNSLQYVLPCYYFYGLHTGNQKMFHVEHLCSTLKLF